MQTAKMTSKGQITVPAEIRKNLGMTMNYLYLLDSNVVSEFSKSSVNGNVVSHFKRKESFCAVSAITLQEMQMGKDFSPMQKSTLLKIENWFE